MTLFYIIVLFIVAEFILSTVLNKLNASWLTKPIPAELDNIYDNEKYQQQQLFSKARHKFESIQSIIMLTVTLGFLFLNGFSFLDNICANLTQNLLLQAIVYILVLSIAVEIIGLPFSIYNTFVIEQKFGFNTTTPKIFVTDTLKNLLLNLILTTALYSAIYWFYTIAGQNFWVYAWLIVACFSLFMSVFYSSLIVPLFNKQTPLPDGELRNAISEFSQKVGFNLDGVFVIDNSKRSNRANAYFTGLFKKKRIVLYDTLINQMTTEEIVAVLAHEVGHYKKRHIVSSLIFGLLQMGIILFVFSLFVSRPELSAALGVATPKFHISLIAFSFLYTPISIFTGLLTNIFSRRNEYQADEFAAQNSSAENLISGLKKLARNNLSNLTPHPAYVWVNYSHPALYQRIMQLKKNK